ncbi:MAG: LacI family transcriptional regulator [Clostridiales bacterium]|nr:LacI family transcriptional regulator [Clostridiales bacterium]
MKKKTTLKDVAGMAGVSVSCASMILNGSAQSRFSAEKVELVHGVAEKLNYCPPAERTIKKQIAVLSPAVNNPYYTMLISGIDLSAFSMGYTTCVFNVYWNPSTEVLLLNRLSQSNYCGIIFIYTPMCPDIVHRLSQSFPIVAIGDILSNLEIDTVDVNNYKAGEMVAEHLLSLGHRHIAYLTTGVNEHHISRVRRGKGLKDYYAACCPDGEVTIIEENNPFEDEIRLPGIEYATGEKLAYRCLEKPEITAIAAINDMVGYGIYDTLVREGFTIPGDYSICGFDNAFPSGLKNISLTSIENHTFSHGKSAVQLLIDRLERSTPGKDGEPISHVEYLPKLIIRGSTGRPGDRQGVIGT